jgi:hypothetical protein
MKRRKCFVANSSSSSFVMIIPKDIHEEAVAKCHPYVVAIATQVLEPATIFGKECLVYHNLDIQGYNSEWEVFELDYDGEYPLTEHGTRMSIYGGWSEYQKHLPDNAIFMSDRYG